MSRPLRVLQLIKSLDRGGAEVLLAEVSKRLPREQYEIIVGYFVPQRNMMVPVLQERGCMVTCLDAPGPAAMFAAVPRLRAWMRRCRPRIVHCHLPLAGAVGRLAAFPLGIPVVYTEHNIVERYHPLTRAANLATWTLQRRVIAVSEEVKKSIERAAGAEVPVETVQNAINVEHFNREDWRADDVRRELGIPGGAPVIGTVAVFRPAKRLDLWLAAAKEILARRPASHFVVVGYGPLDDDVRAWRTQLGLEERVHLVGPQADVRPFLAAMDVYMMSSDFEGLPIALLEAMAMRLPIIATEVGGIGEVIENGRSGWLCPPQDPEAMVAAALRLIDGCASRGVLAENARMRVESAFSMSRMAREIACVYDRALN